MPFNNVSYNVLMKSSGRAKKAVLHASLLNGTLDNDFSIIKLNCFLRSMRAPVVLLQYLQRLWCNLTEDSSEKSTFCHFSSFHPFSRLWALADAACFFNRLLFSARFWALIPPWRPFWVRILQSVLFDTDWRWPSLVKLCCSGKGTAGPGLVKNISSLFKSCCYSLYLTLGHIESVSHLSSRSGLQPLENECFGLRVNLKHVVKGQVAVDVKGWCAGVGFIHTH